MALSAFQPPTSALSPLSPTNPFAESINPFDEAGHEETPTAKSAKEVCVHDGVRAYMCVCVCVCVHACVCALTVISYSA